MRLGSSGWNGTITDVCQRHACPKSWWNHSKYSIVMDRLNENKALMFPRSISEFWEWYRSLMKTTSQTIYHITHANEATSNFVANEIRTVNIASVVSHRFTGNVKLYEALITVYMIRKAWSMAIKLHSWLLLSKLWVKVLSNISGLSRLNKDNKDGTQSAPICVRESQRPQYDLFLVREAR